MGMTVGKKGPVRAARGILALLAMWCAAGAQAQVRVAATASNLNYSIGDLAPGDGVAAAVAFDGATRVALEGRLSAWDGTPPGYLSDTDVVVSTPTVIDRAWSDTASTLAWDGRTMIAAGTVAPVGKGSVYFTGDAGMSWRRFTLAPHTRITFTSDAALDLTLDGGPGTPALGYGSMILEVSDANNVFAVGARSVSDSMSGWVGDDRIQGFNASTATARTLVAAWDNDSDAWAPAYVRLELGAEGEAWAVPAPPVPEPAPWAMLGAGCALVGMWPGRPRRRRGTA